MKVGLGCSDKSHIRIIKRFLIF